MAELPADVSRPVVMYVETVETKPDIDAYFSTRRLSVIDIEIDVTQAEEIARYLQERVGVKLSGSIRLRFTGRLVHV